MYNVNLCCTAVLCMKMFKLNDKTDCYGTQRQFSIFVRTILFILAENLSRVAEPVAEPVAELVVVAAAAAGPVAAREFVDERWFEALLDLVLDLLLLL